MNFLQIYIKIRFFISNIDIVHQQSRSSLAVLKTQKDQEESKLALDDAHNSQIDFEEIHNIANRDPYFKNLNDLSVKSTERKGSMKRPRKSTRRVIYYFLLRSIYVSLS